MHKRVVAVTRAYCCDRNIFGCNE